MSNTIKTLGVGDITRKALAILTNNLVFSKTINREYDDRFARSGAKNGGTLLIREPNQFTVRTGAVMDTQDVTETTQTLTLATQKGVDINFSSSELTLSLDDFSERILKPAMSRLAADVDATVIAACYPGVYNFQNTTFATPPTLVDILEARAKLAKGLAPTSDRICMVDAIAANKIITAGYNIFNPAAEISKQYETGLLGNVYGFKFYESEMTPTHTNGDRDDTTPVTAIGGTVSVPTGGFVNGTASIVVTGADASSTFALGDVFTIAAVYAVNPETKAVYSHLQQFVVTAAVQASGGNVTLAVSPTPQASGAKQNISIASTGSKALVFVLAGGSGAVSTGYINSLAYHKDAFTMVTADLEMPKGVDFAAREVFDGISLRVVRQYDITNDKFPCRVDVLFGQKTIRPEWACRICS